MAASQFLTHGSFWLMAASQCFQKANSWQRHNAFGKPRLWTFRLPYHFIVASQWDGNPAFTVHGECYIAHAFRTATRLTQCCYQVCAEGMNKATPPDIQGSASSKEWNYKKCIYHNLVTRTVAKKFSIGGLCVCLGGLDITKLTKSPLIYSVSRFNLGGLELCLVELGPPKPPPVATGLLVTRPGVQNFLWMLVARSNFQQRTHIRFAIQHSYAWSIKDTTKVRALKVSGRAARDSIS